MRPNSSGKRSIVFNQAEGFKDLPVDLPCGQCIGCRLERSRQWAVRCVHEASLHEDNCFITLTYAEEHLPEGGSLQKEDFQKFMKRLRKSVDFPVRYFQCGEYGEEYFRPHYHACLFGFDFKDKVLWKVVNDQQYFVSLELQRLWPFGHSTIGAVTFESAAYVARYITKKITGPGKESAYEYCDENTGQVFDRVPEYVTMSRRPGIAAGWFEKFKSDVYPDDFVVMRGRKFRPPKFYKEKFELVSPLDAAKAKAERQVAAELHKDNNTWDRLSVREEIQYLKYDQLKRSYENGK